MGTQTRAPRAINERRRPGRIRRCRRWQSWCAPGPVTHAPGCGSRTPRGRGRRSFSRPQRNEPRSFVPTRRPTPLPCRRAARQRSRVLDTVRPPRSRVRRSSGSTRRGAVPSWPTTCSTPTRTLVYGAAHIELLDRHGRGQLHRVASWSTRRSGRPRSRPSRVRRSRDGCFTLRRVHAHLHFGHDRRTQSGAHESREAQRRGARISPAASPHGRRRVLLGRCRSSTRTPRSRGNRALSPRARPPCCAAGSPQRLPSRRAAASASRSSTTSASRSATSSRLRSPRRRAHHVADHVFGNEAAPLDIDRFAQRFGCLVADGYGSTEGGLNMGRTPRHRGAHSGCRLGEVIQRRTLRVVGLNRLLDLIDRQTGDLATVLAAHLRQLVGSCSRGRGARCRRRAAPHSAADSRRERHNRKERKCRHRCRCTRNPRTTGRRHSPTSCSRTNRHRRTARTTDQPSHSRRGGVATIHFCRGHAAIPPSRQWPRSERAYWDCATRPYYAVRQRPRANSARVAPRAI